MRSLVLARDDGVGGFVVFSGCLLVFRHKNIRTKGSFKGRMYIQASLMFICPFNVAPAVLCLRFSMLISGFMSFVV